MVPNQNVNVHATLSMRTKDPNKIETKSSQLYRLSKETAYYRTPNMGLIYYSSFSVPLPSPIRTTSYLFREIKYKPL